MWQWCRTPRRRCSEPRASSGLWSFLVASHSSLPHGKRHWREGYGEPQTYADALMAMDREPNSRCPRLWRAGHLREDGRPLRVDLATNQSGPPAERPCQATVSPSGAVSLSSPPMLERLGFSRTHSVRDLGGPQVQLNATAPNPRVTERSAVEFIAASNKLYALSTLSSMPCAADARASPCQSRRSEQVPAAKA